LVGALFVGSQATRKTFYTEGRPKLGFGARPNKLSVECLTVLMGGNGEIARQKIGAKGWGGGEL